MKQSTIIKNNVLMIGIIFTAFLILANLSAVKLAAWGPFIFPAGLIFFPLTYIFDNILTEVYGFKVSRYIIWSALLANFIVFVGAWLTIYLNPAPFWQDQAAYETIYHLSPRIFIASVLGYFCGEFSNSTILAKLKVKTNGRYLALRVIASTLVGVGIDTVLFTHIAFCFTIPYFAIWQVILTMYSVKVGYEICVLPITYKISNYLKKADEVDHYDVDTKFTPFSLTV